jgi:hypothetical protein
VSLCAFPSIVIESAGRRLNLRSAHDRGFRETGECVHVHSLWREQIDGIGGEAPKHTHGQIEPVRRHDRAHARALAFLRFAAATYAAVCTALPCDTSVADGSG